MRKDAQGWRSALETTRKLREESESEVEEEMPRRKYLKRDIVPPERLTYLQLNAEETYCLATIFNAGFGEYFIIAFLIFISYVAKASFTNSTWPSIWTTTQVRGFLKMSRKGCFIDIVFLSRGIGVLLPTPLYTKMEP